MPIHESWIGVNIELVPKICLWLTYIAMHPICSYIMIKINPTDTHVISSILHIGHSTGNDDEPWPLVLEDLHGNTNEIYLEPGDLLLYESSKCRHGRPKKFNGEYYSSLFSHYYPKYWNHEERQLDIHYRIPSSEIWREAASTTTKGGKEEEKESGVAEINDMSLISLCVKEPQCEHEWCRLKDAKKWYGPGPEYGQVLSGDGKIVLFDDIPVEESFNHEVNKVDILLEEL